MRQKVRTLVVSGVLVGAFTLGATAQSPGPGELVLTFPAEGLVTLVATDVTVRDILAEWSRQTGAVFTNADKLPGGPVTVQYERMSETAVLDSLLRPAAGYLAVPRDKQRPAGSPIAFVYIIPVSRGTAAGPSSPAVPTALPVQVLGPTPEVTPGAAAAANMPPTPEVQGPPMSGPPDPANPPGAQPEPGRSSGPPVVGPVTPVIGPVGGRGGAGGSTPPPPPTGRGAGS